MGMFDYLRCEVDTPDGWKPENGLFQTKDFDNQLVTITITADGRLLQEVITDTEVVPKEERPYPDAPDDDFRSLIGSIRTITRTEVIPDFHGIVHFYGTETVSKTPDPTSVLGVRRELKFHDYQAKFTDGKLVEIKLL